MSLSHEDQIFQIDLTRNKVAIIMSVTVRSLKCLNNYVKCLHNCVKCLHNYVKCLQDYVIDSNKSQDVA